MVCAAFAILKILTEMKLNPLSKHHCETRADLTRGADRGEANFLCIH